MTSRMETTFTSTVATNSIIPAKSDKTSNDEVDIRLSDFPYHDDSYHEQSCRIYCETRVA